jgi:hypothetical protein
MDIIESLHNTIILSGNSLHELYKSKYKLNTIEKLNQNNTEQLNISEKIINSFKSFYNRFLYKNDNLNSLDISINEINNNNNHNEINNIKNNNIKNNEINSINKDTLSMLKIIKENNNLIGIELDQQNKQMNEINVNIDKNNLKVIELKNNIKFS